MDSQKQILRRRDLEDWLRFIRADSHILKEHPELFFQQAANQPGATLPAQAAARRIEANSDPPSWLRWINKPEQRSACMLTLAGHTGGITSLAVAPAARLVVSASGDRTVRLWDLDRGAELALLRHKAVVKAVAVTSDGSRVVSGSENGEVRVWDGETGRCLRLLKGDNGPVNAVAVWPTGDRVAFGIHGALRIWDLTRRKVRTLRGHGYENVTGVGLTNNAGRLVSVSNGTTENAAKANPKQESNNKTIIVWDVESWEELDCVWANTTGSINGLAVSLDGKNAVVCSEEGLLLYSLEKGDVNGFRGEVEFAWALATSGGGRHLVIGCLDATIKVFDCQTGKLIRTLRGHGNIVHAVAVIPDEDWIISGSLDRTIKIWSNEGKSEVHEPWYQTHVSAVAVTGHGRHLLTAGDSAVKRWDTRDGRLLQHVATHDQGVSSMVLTRNSRRMVTGGTNKDINIWGTRSGRRLCHIPTVHTEQQIALAVTPDGSRIVVAGGFYYRHELEVRSAYTGRLVSSLQGHTDVIQSVSFSPDGRFIVSGGWDKTVRVWDATRLCEVFSITDAHAGPIECVTVTPDARRIISGGQDNIIKIWGLEDGQPLVTLKGHTGHVTSLAVSDDGRRIVSGSHDRSVRVWDADQSQLLYLFEGASWVACVAPFENRVYLGDWLGEVRMLELRGLEPRASIVTPRRRFYRLWVLCPTCARRTVISDSDLGGDTTCKCRRLLRINSFITAEHVGILSRVWQAVAQFVVR